MHISLDLGTPPADENLMKKAKTPGQVQLVIGTLMVGCALTIGWLLTPSQSNGDLLVLEENPSTELFSIQNGVYSIRVVSGDPDARFEIVNPDGKVLGRHCSLDSALNYEKKSGFLLLADVSQFDPIN